MSKNYASFLPSSCCSKTGLPQTRHSIRVLDDLMFLSIYRFSVVESLGFKISECKRPFSYRFFLWFSCWRDWVLHTELLKTCSHYSWNCAEELFLEFYIMFCNVCDDLVLSCSLILYRQNNRLICFHSGELCPSHWHLPGDLATHEVHAAAQ